MSSPKPPFQVTQMGIGQILKGRRLKVPPNQRDYSWTEKEVTTLFQDLANAISETKEQGYFLGTIVTIPGASELLEVIDGQQRLATITILLCTIRRYLLSKNIEPEIRDILYSSCQAEISIRNLLPWFQSLSNTLSFRHAPLLIVS